MNIESAVFYLREYLFPYSCGGCGTELPDARSAYFGLCPECENLLKSFLIGERRCELCGRPLISEKSLCRFCRENAAAGTRYNALIVKMYSFFPYTGKFKTILGAYKFGGSLGVGNFLALFPGCVPDSFRGEGAAWVPVPPKPGKIKERGWDQIEYLAHLLEKKRNHSGTADSLSVRRCLRRLPSRSQKELNRAERETNLKGRILCVKAPPQKAVLLDDVVTTGATMSACAAALLEGGAKEVYGVSLFYD